MRAHQVIYTSCRRGIDGVSDGLQVFSYDEGLAACKAEYGSGFSQLFPDPDPSEVGRPALGYHLLGDKCLFTYNTKLPYDYQGPQGRSGNVLRQSVLLSAEELTFAPVEAFGSPVFVSSMGPEVASPEKPDYLPTVDIRPTGELSCERIVDWLGEGERVDRLLELVTSLFRAKTEDKQLVIVADPEEAARWLAAACLAVPLRMSREVSFLLACEQPGLVGGDACGTTREALGRAQDYALASCVTFDPAAPADADYVPADDYLDFVTMSLELNPAKLLDFTAFVGDHCDIGFNLGLFEAAFQLWSLLRDDLPDDEGTYALALPFAEAHADEATREQLANRLTDGLDQLEGASPAILLGALGYLIRAGRSLGSDNRRRVEEVAGATVAGLISDRSVSEEEFSSRLDEILGSCAQSGVDPLSILGGERGAALGESASSAEKLCVLCGSTMVAVVDRGCEASELDRGGAVSSLVKSLVGAAYRFGPQEGLRAARLVSEPFADVAKLYVGVANATLEACDAARPGDEACLRALWDALADGADVSSDDATLLLMRWLGSCGKYEGAARLFARAASQRAGSREVASLYRACCSGDLFSNAAMGTACYPAVARAYVDELVSRGDRDGERALTAFVASVADGAENDELLCGEQFGEAMRAAGLALEGGVDPLNPTPDEERLSRYLLGYEALAHHEVMGPRMLRLVLSAQLRRSCNANRPDDAVSYAYHVMPRLRANPLSVGETEAFLVGVSGIVVDLSRVTCYLAYLTSYLTSSNREASVLLCACADRALDLLKRRLTGAESLGIVLACTASLYPLEVCEEVAERAMRVRKDARDAVRAEAQRFFDPKDLEDKGFRVNPDARSLLGNMLRRVDEGRGLSGLGKKLFGGR